ncbi:hypothetical protein LM601244_40446 [Listeria monocytogenes]|nr:hypothetical protein LM601244_40446 [Listeria monocytogenes]
MLIMTKTHARVNASAIWGMTFLVIPYVGCIEIIPISTTIGNTPAKSGKITVWTTTQMLA